MEHGYSRTVQRRARKGLLRTWNALRRTQAHMKRTNNYAEGFHSGFTQLIGCTNPNIWACLRALKLQQSITDGKMSAEICGERPPKMCTREVKKNARLTQATGQIDNLALLEYLDLAMAL